MSIQPFVLTLSDLHFYAGAWSHLNGKRLLAQINWHWRRRMPGLSVNSLLKKLVDSILQLPQYPEACLIAGDLGQTGRHEEWQQIATIISPLQQAGIPVLVVDGNHDHYGGRDASTAMLALQHQLAAPAKIIEPGLVTTDNFCILLLTQGQVNTIFSAAGHWRGDAWLKYTGKIYCGERICLALGHYPVQGMLGGEVIGKNLRGLDNITELRNFLDLAGVSLYISGHDHLRRGQISAISPNCAQLCMERFGSRGQTVGVWRVAVADKESENNLTITPFDW